MGSGYLYLSLPICSGLAELGYDVKAVGIGNDGSEHPYPFSIIPAKDVKSAFAIARNMHFLDWKPDVIIIALDIPLQHFFLEKLADIPIPKILITPLENGPLTMSWAAPLMSADAVYFISELGASEARKSGIVDAQHIQIGTDLERWPVPTEETKTRIRKSMDLEGKFVILTVADNQERKNLWAALDIVSKVKKLGVDNLKFILVTREHSPVGNKIMDLAIQMDIVNELTVIERGVSHAILYSFYAAADLFLLTSKAEGLGLPLLEAMSCGLPVMATNTGAVTELMGEDRGTPIDPEYEFVDVWGNSKRSMIDREAAAQIIYDDIKYPAQIKKMAENALHYVKSLTWDIPVQQLHKKIEELTNEQKET